MRYLALVLCLCWLALPAPASVVMTRLDPPAQAGMSDELPHVFIDFDHDGQTDLLLYNGGGAFVAYFYGGSSRMVVVSDPPPNLGGPIASLEFGSIIGPSLTPVPVDPRIRWYEGGLVLDPSSLPYGDKSVTGMIDLFPSGPAGPIYNKEGVIGYEFLSGGNKHYGYVHYDFSPSNGSPLQGGAGLIRGWAYENVPGMSITAMPVPEPAAVTLIILALGCLLNRRKQI